MLVAPEAGPLRPQGDVSCAETPAHLVPRQTGQTAPWHAPVTCALQWSLQRLPPCGNGTVLNDQPLVYEQLLRWHTQGNCLCSQTGRIRLCAVALVALVEIQAPMEVEGLPRVLATRVL